MMLKVALVALALGATTALASPQQALPPRLPVVGRVVLNPINITSTPPDPVTTATSVTSSPGNDGPGEAGIAPPSTASVCDGLSSSCSEHLIHVESSVTGFDDQPGQVTLQPVTTPAQTVDILTTSTPSLVNIHTELASNTQENAVDPAETPSADNSPAPNPRPTAGSSPKPADSPSPVGNSSPGSNTSPGQIPAPGDSPATGEPQATSTPNSLLLDIVTRIGIPVSSIVQPTNPGDESQPSPSNADAQFKQATDSGPSASSPDAPPVITANGQLTLGSSVLTLTPGLSSMLGDGAAATYVAITTDDAGQTLITVSSSGTAVTATITNAPTTLTKPRTGSEATITTTAHSTPVQTSSADMPAASTSSRGSAVSQKVEYAQWLYAGMGLMGFGMVAG